MNTPQPIGCPGRIVRMAGGVAAYCRACPLHGQPGKQIQPRAGYSPELNRWTCPDRAAATSETNKG